MKIIAGIQEVPIKDITIGEYVSIDGRMRSAIRVALDGSVSDIQLSALTENIWQLSDGEAITDTFEGYNTLYNHELVFAKVPTAQQEIDSALKPILDVLTDEQALNFVDSYPEWVVGKTYSIGDRIRYNAALYKVLQAHISQSDWAPESAPSLFAKVLISETEEILEWVQPDSTNAYMTGDKVIHNNTTWESLVDNNVWEPGAVGSEALWSEVTE